MEKAICLTTPIAGCSHAKIVLCSLDLRYPGEPRLYLKVQLGALNGVDFVGAANIDLYRFVIEDIPEIMTTEPVDATDPNSDAQDVVVQVANPMFTDLWNKTSARARKSYWEGVYHEAYVWLQENHPEYAGSLI